MEYDCTKEVGKLVVKKRTEHENRTGEINHKFKNLPYFSNPIILLCKCLNCAKIQEQVLAHCLDCFISHIALNVIKTNLSDASTSMARE